MRIARFTAILTIALGSFLPGHAQAASPAGGRDDGPVQVVGGAARGAINIANMVVSCQHPQRCIAGRPES
jgi:hypothetical protein